MINAFEMEETEKLRIFLVIKGASDIRRAGVENITFAHRSKQHIMYFGFLHK